MTPARAAGVALLLLAVASAPRADAQARALPKEGWSVVTTTPRDAAASTATIRARFGADVAARLARSADREERLRGIERLGATHTPESLALLERAAEAAVPGPAEARAQLEGAARRDPRALLAVVHGLAGWIDHEPARAALASIVGAPAQSLTTTVAATAGEPGDDPAADEADGAAQVLLARQEAAIALAGSGSVQALEGLIALARSASSGQGPALDALVVHPPAPPLLGGVVLTTPATVALAVAVGDLRSLDAIQGALSASDPVLRATALTALGLAGDSRVLDGARAALSDRDPRVRLAAGDALVRLGAPDAAKAVEGLVADDATALDGLRLAQLAQGDGIVRAAAARAVASASADVRAAAVAALGRQTGALALDALTALVADPSMQGDASCALARSSSPGATAAIEAMAGRWPRMAARAYFVRRFVRGERSARLDALIEGLAASKDARDRAVGIEALVALGPRAAAAALGDADPRVRRAAAAGALGSWGEASRRALLARMAVETDATTRQVLAIGFVGGDVDGEIVPTGELLVRARSGGADAPLAALALAARGDPKRDEDVDALLAARDPVLRAHVARGLGASTTRDATGRLARAYAREGDVSARRAILEALAGRPDAASTPAGRDALDVAARLDPDRVARWAASRALAGARPARSSDVREVAWLRVVPAEGAALPPDMTGALLSVSPVSGGAGASIPQVLQALQALVALPFAFDDDGYALVPVGPVGDPESARVRLAPRLPPYEPLHP
jgi:HEAT repeat protein